MLTLSAKIRKLFGGGARALRRKGFLPGVLYGPKIGSISIEIDPKEFAAIYKEAGGSSLISLEIEGAPIKKALALIHEVQKHPLTGVPLHVDFYQPSLEEKVGAKVPLVFEGEAEAVKNLGGTLLKNINEIEVKALPQNLPKSIIVNVESLKTFEDFILVENLKIPEGVEILKSPKEIVAKVVPQEKIEEELAKPVEEKVEEVQVVKEKKEEEEQE